MSEIAKAANRLADNLAFVINHVDLPDQWYVKFVRELDEDRKAIAAFDDERMRLRDYEKRWGRPE